MPEAAHTRKCPVCGAPVDWKGSPSRPFCSERCKLIDLGAWASGRYAIPGQAAGGEEEKKKAEEAAEGEESGEGTE